MAMAATLSDGVDDALVDEKKTVCRYCRVARYDDEYRDQGFIIHMGGIGAKNEKDYDLIADFVERPWRYRVWEAESTPSALICVPTERSEGCVLERRHTEEKLDKPLGKRSMRTLTS